MQRSFSRKRAEPPVAPRAVRSTRAGHRSSSARVTRTRSSHSWARRPGSTRIARAHRSRVASARSSKVFSAAWACRSTRSTSQPCSSAGRPREPRSAAGGVGRVRALSLPPARPGAAASRRDARELRDRTLSGSALGITRVHGQEQDVTLGGSRVASTRSTTRPPRCTRRTCSRCSKRTSGAFRADQPPAPSGGPRARAGRVVLTPSWPWWHPWRSPSPARSVLAGPPSAPSGRLAHRAKPGADPVNTWGQTLLRRWTWPVASGR